MDSIHENEEQYHTVCECTTKCLPYNEPDHCVIAVLRSNTTLSKSKAFVRPMNAQLKLVLKVQLIIGHCLSLNY